MAPSAVAPQCQPSRLWTVPVSIWDVVLASASGTSETIDVFTTLAMFCTVASTPPLALVWTPATYFVCCETVRISQPQPLTPGAVAGPDWYTSVIEVRHELIARITSDIFARIV